MPVNIPDVKPIVPTAVLPLTHVPPVTVLDKVVLVPMHVLAVPPIVPADAVVVTVTL